MMKNRRLGLGPVTSAAFTYWPSHFPNRSREVNISGLCHQSGHGTSTHWDVEVVSIVETDGEEKQSVTWMVNRESAVWVVAHVMTLWKLFLEVVSLQCAVCLSHLAGIGWHWLQLGCFS